VSEVAEELPAGTRIADRYTLVERMSEGAMGAVYRGSADEGGPVAIKRLLDPGQAARFEIEGRLLERLHHNRVVGVIEHLSEPAGQFLVMDLVEGIDLDRELREQGSPGLPLENVLEYAQQAAEALTYVHDQNVVHRDVKPHNLVRGPDGLVLVDFGIAREEAAEQGGTRAIGTPLYMAPEILVGEEVSARSDVYSLAATIWALLLGKPPAYDDPTPLSETVPGAPPQLEDTLRAALAIRPERRLASVAALADGLGVSLEGAEGRGLALSVSKPAARSDLLEAIAHTAAGTFDAAAASVALVDPSTSELVYQSAWGAAAHEIVGVRMPPGRGIAGSVVKLGQGLAIPDCRNDPRFASNVARKVGYVPHTMLVVPLVREGEAIGALSLLDRRDGGGYRPPDVERAMLFADLAVTALAEPGQEDVTRVGTRAG